MSAAASHKDAGGTAQVDVRRFDLRRLIALVTKESYQALRDPSTLLIAFVLPVVVLLLFAYAVSLDAKNVRVGVVLESPGAAAQELAAAFAGTRFLDAHFAHDRREVADQLDLRRLRGYVVIPQDFEQRLASVGASRWCRSSPTARNPIPPTTSRTMRAAWSRPGAPGSVSRRRRRP
jgi:ABC-2 type transport system permease protein